MNARTALPAWAEDVFARWAPQPAYGAAAADLEAMRRYEAMTTRFRSRWWAELHPDVWAKFEGADSTAGYQEQAQHLLGAMIDLARYSSRTEMQAKREALASITALEDELRAIAQSLADKIERRAELAQAYQIEGGIDDDALEALREAAIAAATQSWREPRLCSSDFAEAINSRKSNRDALNAMLVQLERIEPMLMPVRLSDKARAAIYNAAYDADAEYGPEAIKQARAALRKR
jgi:hypothetical protein